MGKCNLAALKPLKLKSCPNPIFMKGIIPENVLDIGCPTPTLFFKYKNEINLLDFCFFVYCRSFINICA